METQSPLQMSQQILANLGPDINGDVCLPDQGQLDLQPTQHLPEGSVAKPPVIDPHAGMVHAIIDELCTESGGDPELKKKLTQINLKFI